MNHSNQLGVGNRETLPNTPRRPMLSEMNQPAMHRSTSSAMSNDHIIYQQAPSQSSTTVRRQHDQHPIEHQSMLPAYPPQPPAQLPVQHQPKPSGGGLLGGLNLSKLTNLTEIKGFVDRMGGLDGILTTVTKAQKIVSSVSQMAPLVKVFFGSFGSKNKSSSSQQSSSSSRPRRRRRPSNSGSSSSNGARRRRNRPASRRPR